MKGKALSRVITRLALVCIALLSAVWWTGGAAPPARAATFTVTNCSADDGSAGTLRAVIAAAAAGDTVTFACDGTISLTSTLALTKSVTIDGAGHHVTLDGFALGRTSAQQQRMILVACAGAHCTVVVTLNDVTIQSGWCVCTGSAIANGGTLTVTNSSIFDSSLSAISNCSVCTLTIANSTFGGDDATGYGSTLDSGGAIYNSSGGTVNITNSTFWLNSADSGGAIFNSTAAVTKGTVRMANTILQDSTGGNCSGPIIDLGGNLADDSSCAFTQSSSKNNVTAFTRFMANYDGPTETYALSPGDPAIGAGVSSICNAAPVNGLDQRGFPRSSTSCDSGAYDTGDVPPAPIAVTVSGGQTYGASSPTFTPAYTTPAGATVTGSVSCATVDGGTALGAALPAGSHTIDGTSCAGLSAPGYSFAYTGGSFAVAPADQTITFGPLAGKTYGDAPFTVSATASSGLPVSFATGATDSCTVSGRTVTITGAGSCTITASQPGDTDYTAAPSVAQSFSIARATPRITWSTPAGIVYGTPLGSTQLDATAPVAGTFAYTPASGTLLHAGSGQTLSTTFTPADVADYTTATAGVTIDVGQAPLTVTADSQSMVYGTSLPSLTVSDTGFVNGDTAPSALSGSPTCTTPATSSSAPGSYPITCTAGTLSAPDYSPTFVPGTLTIGKANQTITFGPLAGKTYGDAPFTVSATASSGLPVSFATGATDSCTVSGRTVTITGAGSCTITASQPGDTDYTAAPSVAQSFSIVKAATTTRLASSANPSTKGKAVTFTATVTSAAGTPGGTVTFRDGSTVLGASTLNASGAATVTTSSLSKGTHSITAVYGGNANVSGSTSAVLSQTVK